MQIRVQTDADHIKEEDRGGGGGSYNLAGELDAAAAAEGINLNAAGREGKRRGKLVHTHLHFLQCCCKSLVGAFLEGACIIAKGMPVTFLRIPY